MLGSSHAGERAAAALKATEFIKGRGQPYLNLSKAARLLSITLPMPKTGFFIVPAFHLRPPPAAFDDHYRTHRHAELDLVIESGKVTAYRAKLKVSFKYEG